MVCGLFYLLGIRVRGGQTHTLRAALREIVVSLLGYARCPCRPQLYLQNFIIPVYVLEVLLLLLVIVKALLGGHLLWVCVVVVRVPRNRGVDGVDACSGLVVAVGFDV